MKKEAFRSGTTEFAHPEIFKVKMHSWRTAKTISTLSTSNADEELEKLSAGVESVSGNAHALD